MSATGTCEVDGCEVVAYARGHCGRHYKQLLRYGEVRPDRGAQTCSVDACGRPAESRGWCHGHYLRWSRTGRLDEERPLSRPTPKTCSVDGCERPARARGLCKAHRERLLTDGPAFDVPLREPPQGTGFVHHGYFRVPVPPVDRWLVGGATSTGEHRLVMARLLGRPLRDDESVHHRNGDRLDNRPDNLELWSRFQPVGQRTADKLAWAREILRRYDPASLREDVTGSLGVGTDEECPG